MNFMNIILIISDSDLQLLRYAEVTALDPTEGSIPKSFNIKEADDFLGQPAGLTNLSTASSQAKFGKKFYLFLVRLVQLVHLVPNYTEYLTQYTSYSVTYYV